jgi:hypothetical protein
MEERIVQRRELPDRPAIGGTRVNPVEAAARVIGMKDAPAIVTQRRSRIAEAWQTRLLAGESYFNAEPWAWARLQGKLSEINATHGGGGC